jgi:hypothetical protein
MYLLFQPLGTQSNAGHCCLASTVWRALHVCVRCRLLATCVDSWPFDLLPGVSESWSLCGDRLGVGTPVGGYG